MMLGDYIKNDMHIYKSANSRILDMFSSSQEDEVLSPSHGSMGESLWKLVRGFSALHLGQRVSTHSNLATLLF